MMAMEMFFITRTEGLLFLITVLACVVFRTRIDDLMPSSLRLLAQELFYSKDGLI